MNARTSTADVGRFWFGPTKFHFVRQAYLFIAIGATLSSCELHAQDENTNDPFRITIGFNEKLKLGTWSPVSFEFDEELRPVQFEIVALDGNGIPTKCNGPLTGVSDNRGQGWIRLGRKNGTAKFSLLDESGTVVASKTVSTDRQQGFEILDSTVPLVLTIEAEDRIAQNIKSIESQLFGGQCEVTAISDTSRLPTSYLAYQGVQVIFLTTSDASLIEQLTDDQWLALQQWIAGGGKLVFCAGQNSELLLSNQSRLSKLVPGKFDSSFDITKISRLETYAKIKQQQLLKRGDPPILAAKVDQPEGIVELSVAGNPIVIRQPYQFGQIVFSAIDFDIPPIADWAGQKNYLMKLTFGDLNLNQTLTGDSQTRRTFMQRGHKDILGQLIFPLEKFSQVRFFNFTIVAVLIGLFILCVGPGDFFLLRKLFGKMEWTWITFSLLALGFGLLAVLLSRSTKPKNAQANQLEIIDIDSASNSIRGNVWTNIYSPKNASCDITPPTTHLLEFGSKQTVVSWMGLPGEGLGGMQSNTQSGLQVQEYDSQFGSAGADNTLKSQLTNVPIKVGSTKTIYLQYSASHDFGIRSRLRVNSRNRLQGTITNPFDHQLKDCRLLFENWAYLIGPPVEPGDSVDVMSAMRERTSSSYFSRRTDTETDKGGGLPWRPQEDDIDRICEMMMFFQAASGPQYTGLSHSFQPYVDLSEQLNLRRAILFGRIESVGTKLDIRCSGSNVEYDQTRTYVRIVLPVE